MEMVIILFIIIHCCGYRMALNALTSRIWIQDKLIFEVETK